MRILLFLGGVAAFSCFFSIIAIPFARVPLSLDAIMLSVLYPLDFFLGSIAFFCSFISHTFVLQMSFKLRKKNALKALLGIFIYLSPIVFISYSLKIVILLFSFSCLYQIIYIWSSKAKRPRSNWKKDVEVE